jgi:hypothetical protein
MGTIDTIYKNQFEAEFERAVTAYKNASERFNSDTA